MRKFSPFKPWTGYQLPLNGNPLSQALRACRHALVTVGVFSFFVNLLLLASPFYTLQIYDRVLPSNSIETLVFLTLIALFILGALALFEVVRGQILLNLGEWFEAYLSRSLFERMIVGTLAADRYQGEALRDLGTLRAFMSGPAMIALIDALWVPGFLAVTFMLHWVLGVVALTAAVILFGFAFIDEMITREPLKKAGEASAIAAGHAAAAARSAELVESMGMTGQIATRWFARNREALLSSRQASTRSKKITAASRFCRLAVQVFLMGAGALLVLDHQITAGVMFASSIIMSRALAPVEQSITIWRQLVATRFAMARLHERFEGELRPQSSVQLPAPTGRLSVEAMTYVPRPGEKPILRNLSFELPAGEVLAIVGPSGAGKSTLARLLVGVYRPSAGHVRLDGAEIYVWPREDFGRHIGYLPQVVQLLPGTIRDNIARMGEGDDESVVAAAKLAGIHELILRLPKGYDTMVGDQSLNLSGGQRQRLGLALALYGNPRYVVLDEPNANLDTEGEEALAHAVGELKARKATVILITHRTNLVGLADKMLLLRDGVNEAYGPRAQVLERINKRPAVVPVPGPAPNTVQNAEAAR